MDRDAALEHIAELAREHALSADEIRAAIEVESPGAPGWARSLLAVLGGLFVLAGAVAALDRVWADLVPGARVLAVFGTGIAALALAMAASRDPRFERAGAPLFLAAALFEASGLFVLFGEFPTGFEPETDAALVFGALALQFAAVFGWFRRTELLFLVLAFAFLFFAAVLTRLGVDEHLISVVLGVSGLLATFGIERTRWRGFAPLAWAVFALCLTIGCFELLESTFPADLLLIAIAALLIQASVRVGSRSLLVVSVLAMLAYLGYYTREYFADTLGWPIALVLFGLVLLALSGYALRLGRRIRPDRSPAS